jgi:hypothetical protein
MGLFGRALHVTVLDDAAAGTAIAKALESIGLTILSLTPIEPSLEDVFIHLVESAGGALAS